MLPSLDVPTSLRYQPDPIRPGRFRVVAINDEVLAEGIPTEAAARLFAASPELALGYEDLLEHAVEQFHRVFDLSMFGPDFEDFLDDKDGSLEEEFPGATDDAHWLQGLRDELDGALGIQPFRVPQVKLF